MTTPEKSAPNDWRQSGFSEAQRLDALTLRTRIQNGENIPLEDLRKFIIAAENDLRQNRVSAAKPVTPKPAPQTDVDFF